GAAPCGCQMPTKRRTGAAAVRRSGVTAGTIDSSNGSASVTPAPRRNVRRGMCFFVMNMVRAPPEIRRTRKGPPYMCRLISSRAFVRCFHSHLELRALDDAQHDGREPVVVPGHILHDRADDRHVGVFDAAAQRVR